MRTLLRCQFDHHSLNEPLKRSTSLFGSWYSVKNNCMVSSCINELHPLVDEYFFWTASAQDFNDCNSHLGCGDNKGHTFNEDGLQIQDIRKWHLQRWVSNYIPLIQDLFIGLISIAITKWNLHSKTFFVMEPLAPSLCQHFSDSNWPLDQTYCLTPSVTYGQKILA